MIKTKSMAVRDNSLPYVDASNNLIGTMNPLKFFVCPNGVEAGVGLTEATSKFFCDFGADLDATAGNKIIISSATGVAGVQNSEADANFNAVVTAISLGANDDALLITCGETYNQATTTAFCGLRDSGTTTSSVITRALENGAAPPAGLIDDTPATFTSAADEAPLVVAGSDYMFATAVDRSGNLSGIRNGGTTATTLPTKTVSLSGSIALDFATSPEVQLKLDAYAMGYFVFPNNTLPLDWESQASWMAWNWAQQNYVFPESWANL